MNNHRAALNALIDNILNHFVPLLTNLPQHQQHLDVNEPDEVAFEVDRAREVVGEQAGYKSRSDIPAQFKTEFYKIFKVSERAE